MSTLLRDVVGGKTATSLEKAFEYTTVQDLLHHFPRRYERSGELTDIGSLEEGEYATIIARVVRASSRRMQKRSGYVSQVVVTDGRSEIDLAFFGWDRSWEKRVGEVAMFSGKVTMYRRRRQFAQPAVYKLEADEIEVAPRDMIPIYPATAAVSSQAIEAAVAMVLDVINWTVVPDPLPPDIVAEEDLMSTADSYEAMHRPATYAQMVKGKKRMRWQEALALQTVLVHRRQLMAEQPARARLPVAGGLVDQLDQRLPFELTDGQREIGECIQGELASSHPMHRLLQGEVGSGKTVVALRAMLAVVDAGGQAALLAPTEVLAAQHFRSITDLLGPLAQGGTLGGALDGTKVALLTGSQKTAARREALLDAASGAAGIVIGTHALLEDTVTFADLGLVVVDEQHRFGVEQRAKLAAKTPDGDRPHILVMTATPIPRTVAITVFGELEVSTLSELPKGRAGITTHVVPAKEKPNHLERTWERIREEVAQGRQAYIVAPRIDDSSDEADAALFDPKADATESARRAASVEALAKELAEGPLAGLRIGVMHGRLPGEEKDKIMRRFAAGPSGADPIDVLISTTVIEVGVDVPNATVMVVMDADWFGISQLHQLRGRIGRGGRPGLCLLVTYADAQAPSRKRLADVASTTDGFELSRLDLLSRREGDVLGTTQAGRTSSLRALELLKDEEIIIEARAAAEEILADDPALVRHPALRDLATEFAGEGGAAWLDRS